MCEPTAFRGDWPPGCKRVRYSQNFPHLPEHETSAFVLMTSADWQKLARVASVITCNDLETYEKTRAIMSHYFYGKIKMSDEMKGSLG